MPTGFRFGAELFLLTAGYALVDFLLREEGFLRGLRRIGVARPGPAAILWILPCLALVPFWTWRSMPQGESIRFLATALAALLAWQAATKDVDPVTGETRGASRLMLVVATAGIPLSPAFLAIACFLLAVPFALWQHHATLPMRLLQALTAHAALAAALSAAPLFRDASVLVFFLLTMLASHYLITGLAKIRLGPKWHSWATDNRLHHLAASAYSWGWARFLPWSAWLRVIAAVRRAEKPLQFLAFGVELLAPLALLHRDAAVGFCLAWAGFHAGVFLISGLLFWDWIGANLAVAAFLIALPSSAAPAAFGPASVAAALLFLIAFPLRHKLWKPMPLGWFDTPFTQRVHWRVRGASGTEYGLYNDFMCPHERLYGKVHGCFLAPVPVMTYHLGEVWKPELRDALRDAGPDPARLDAVRARFGIDPRCEERGARHEAYLRRFFHALNGGARKRVLPCGLRWLKAPGDQVFYWGDLPAYRGQERVVEVLLHYCEEYFDGRNLHRLRDDLIRTIPIGPEEPPAAPAEPSPREIDDFLLGRAAGRLIDLPSFGGGYVGGDDGRTARAVPEAG